MTRKSYHEFQERTAELESSKRYDTKSKRGYLGRYQFGVGALMDAGYYKGDKVVGRIYQSDNINLKLSV